VIERHYQTLGVSEAASARELKEAYRDLVKVWHPDRFPQGSKLRLKAEQKTKEITAAYAEIEDFRLGKRGPESRAFTRQARPEPKKSSRISTRVRYYSRKLSRKGQQVHPALKPLVATVRLVYWLGIGTAQAVMILLSPRMLLPLIGYYLIFHTGFGGRVGYEMRQRANIVEYSLRQATETLRAMGDKL
jgi:hypothetical protein